MSLNLRGERDMTEPRVISRGLSCLPFQQERRVKSTQRQVFLFFKSGSGRLLSQQTSLLTIGITNHPRLPFLEVSSGRRKNQCIAHFGTTSRPTRYISISHIKLNAQLADGLRINEPFQVAEKHASRRRHTDQRANEPRQAAAQHAANDRWPLKLAPPLQLVPPETGAVGDDNHFIGARRRSKATPVREDAIFTVPRCDKQGAHAHPHYCRAVELNGTKRRRGCFRSTSQRADRAAP